MTFALIDSIDILDGSTSRRIALYEGDLTAIPKENRADILVVSAFPDYYVPTSTSLIGSLYGRGLSVDALAKDKAHDLRATCGFWLSNPIGGEAAALNVGRIACFEPLMLGSAASIVGDLFRGLFPFLDDRKDQVVAMPVLATGDQGSPPVEMLSNFGCGVTLVSQRSCHKRINDCGADRRACPGFGSDNGRFQAKIGRLKYKTFTIGGVRRFS
jgi:hypothetical protein